MLQAEVNAVDARLDGAPDAAQVASYFLVVTAAGADRWGRYRDLLVPTADSWLFARRRITFDPRDPGSA